MSKGIKQSLLKGSFIAITLFVLLAVIAIKPSSIQAYVSKVSASSDTLQVNSKAIVMSSGSIVIPNPDLLMQILAPRPVIDPLYTLLLFLFFIIIVFYFWDFSYTKPFSIKAFYGLRLSFWLILIFLIANFFRYDWFSKQVSTLTSGQFIYNKPFLLSSPEFWMLLVLIRFNVIFKKGIILQNDSDLTV